MTWLLGVPPRHRKIGAPVAKSSMFRSENSTMVALSMESPPWNHHSKSRHKSPTPWPIWIVEMWKFIEMMLKIIENRPTLRLTKKKQFQHMFRTNPTIFEGRPPFSLLRRRNRPLFGEHDATVVNKWTSCPRWPIGMSERTTSKSPYDKKPW